MKDKSIVVRPLLAAAAALLALFLCFSASQCDMLVLGVDRSAQKDIVPEFFSALQAGDYDGAMEYVSNYETLGFEKQSSELVEFYKSKLIDSYSVTVIDHDYGDSSGLAGQQLIDLTLLDSRLLLAAVNEKTAVAVTDFMYNGSQLESDQQALGFVYDALYECLETPEVYYSTQRLIVNTEYDGREWRILVDEALLDALNGYITTPFTDAGAAVSGADTAEGDELA